MDLSFIRAVTDTDGLLDVVVLILYNLVTTTWKTEKEKFVKEM